MEKPVTISFRTTADQLRALRSKVPKDGDRSMLLRKLVELYVSGKINVPTPQRP